MTEQEFRNSNSREALHKLLNEEPLKTALELIESKPSVVPLGANGLHHSDAVLARILAESVGVNKAINHLKRLAQPLQAERDPSDLDSDPERPYGYDYLPEPLKEAFRQQFNNNK